MTNEKSFMSNMKLCIKSYVKFRDGGNEIVAGKGQLNFSGLLTLYNVLLVEGLTANLFSISQLCDQDMIMNLSKTSCVVGNKDATIMMKGI